MQYDFDSIVDRKHNNSAKYEDLLKKFGRPDVIPLWVADMDFKTAQPIIDALKQKAEQGIYGYTSRPDSYHQVLTAWLQRRHAFSPDPSLFAFSPGIVPALAVIVQQFTEPGDPVLIQTPVYPEFAEAIESGKRKVLNCQLTEKDGKYEIDFAAFEEALRQGPRLFILCHPHNPVGRIWTDAELTRMAELCIQYKTLIVSDEIHADFMLWGNKHRPMASLGEHIAANTITCLSATKTFNLAGLQASSILFPNPEMKQAFERFWANIGFMRNNAFSVVAMEAAWTKGDEWLDQLLLYLEGNMQFVSDFMKERIPRIKPNMPQCTYLIWLDCRELGLSDAELQRFMVEKAGLGMNAGIAFGLGGEGFMRLNAACPRSVLERAMSQLEGAVKA